MRAVPLLACGVAVAALSSPAFGEGRAAALVRLLDVPGRTHPLAGADGRIPLSVILPAGADARALGLLQVAPGIGAIHLAPGDVGVFAGAHPDLTIGVTPRYKPLLDVSPAWTRVDTFRTSTGGVEGQQVIVGVVDTGLDIRHPDFLTKDGHTRVAWMLAAGPPAGLHPDLEKQFGCTDPSQSPCAIYAQADIDAMVAAGNTTVTDTEGHGTHVTSIAAGNGGPSVTPKPRFVGLAPEATIIVASPANSGGFSDADILNATSFIFDRADAMGLPKGCSGSACAPVACNDPAQCTPAPVVVNLSLGSDYGPHDGTGALEQGLSAFVGDQHPGRAIVVAAGNSGELDDPGDGTGPYGIHTEAHLFDGEEIRVPIMAGAASMNGQAFVWITFHPGDNVSVGLEGPGKKTWVGLTGKGDQGGYQSGSGSTANTGGVVNDNPADNGSITSTNSAIVEWSGHWDAQDEFAIHLSGTGDASLWLTAQQDAAGALAFEKAIRQGTINVPASAPGLLAVGCTVNRVSWTPLGGKPVVLGALGQDMDPVADSACYFSADGPTPDGVEKPEISAPGAFVAAAMSAAADPRVNPGGLFDLADCPSGDAFCALLDDRHALAAGTSMSAPQVAGTVALLMDLDVTMNGTPTLTQAKVTQVLQAGARKPLGHVPDADQIGPGALDVEGARISLLQAFASSTEPDARSSWYTLSSAYARPDPTWPVWGAVELRQSNGDLAAVDGSQLQLQLQGGTVYQPFTQVRQGYWRFAVAGRPEDLGTSITLNVLYAGTPVHFGTTLSGETTLPVGFDAWTAGDPSLTAASGACALAPGRTGGPLGLFTALAALAAAARRRSRADPSTARGAR